MQQLSEEESSMAKVLILGGILCIVAGVGLSHSGLHGPQPTPSQISRAFSQSRLKRGSLGHPYTSAGAPQGSPLSTFHALESDQA